MDFMTQIRTTQSLIILLNVKKEETQLVSPSDRFLNSGIKRRTRKRMEGPLSLMVERSGSIAVGTVTSLHLKNGPYIVIFNG